jgi:hypothetical protein
MAQKISMQEGFILNQELKFPLGQFKIYSQLSYPINKDFFAFNILLLKFLVLKVSHI